MAEQQAPANWVRSESGFWHRAAGERRGFVKVLCGRKIWPAEISPTTRDGRLCRDCCSRLAEAAAHLSSNELAASLIGSKGVRDG
jgi:hypothetical protein